MLQHNQNKQIIPIGGNAWTSNGGKITENGLTDWNNSQIDCKIYFKIAQSGKLNISILLKPEGNESKISVNIAGKSIEFSTEGNTEKEYFVGQWDNIQKGYVTVVIKGVSKTGATFGTLTSLTVSGNTVNNELSFVKSNKDDFFHWGRRGPSVHLNYSIDAIENIEWFYNEVTVPEENDIIGSYFMANGFEEGYFGMQVNSDQERRILFSIWSPFKTDDPITIPQEQKILLLKKGMDVFTGEFGNEGSGGQSYLKYNWKAGNTYKFLLQGKPTNDNCTIYTAYFFAPEENQWRIIASFSRPETTTYLKCLHSFLENFMPETGNKERMAFYNNQWVFNTKNGWTEINQIILTGDNTAQEKYRLDYGGGEKEGKFYLRNCGFFNSNTRLNSQFTRPVNGKSPEIDFSKLS